MDFQIRVDIDNIYVYIYIHTACHESAQDGGARIGSLRGVFAASFSFPLADRGLLL